MEILNLVYPAENGVEVEIELGRIFNSEWFFTSSIENKVEKIDSDKMRRSDIKRNDLSSSNFSKCSDEFTESCFSSSLDKSRKSSLPYSNDPKFTPKIYSNVQYDASVELIAKLFVNNSYRSNKCDSKHQ